MTPSYQDDILDQPNALQHTLEGLHNNPPLTGLRQGLDQNKFQRIVLTGMGSSYFAAHPLVLRLIEQGYHAQAIETSELIHHAAALIEPHTLIVAVSQSGESIEVVRLMEQAKNKTAVIGVTNTPDSLLARQASAVILTRAGGETSVSCKTYVATLAALCWLGDQFSRDTASWQLPQLADIPDRAARYLSGHRKHMDRLMELLAGIHYLILAGRGISLAAAGDGALIIKESTHFPAEGMSSAAFRHGPLEMVSPQVFVLIYTGLSETAGLNRNLAQDVMAVGGMAEVVQTGAGEGPFDLPSCNPACLPILEILPAQMISLALAARQGFEPGRFAHIGKVTRIE